MGVGNVSPTGKRAIKTTQSRVNELAEKAYEDAIKHNPSFLVNSEMVRKKFAELLIFETMDVCIEAQESGKPMYDAVLKHFDL